MSGITFGIIALNAQPFLQFNLRALYPFAQQIIVVEGATRAAVSLATEDGRSTDGTLEAIREFQDNEDPEGKVHLVTARDEGYADGFWPEKDEMSQAYARRAEGDWLWQVDSDEFYLEKDIRKVCEILEQLSHLGGIAFPFHEFWGGFNTVTTGKWYLQDFKEVARIFRWRQGYSYTGHRPPTVVDEGGNNLTEREWLLGSDMRCRDIYLRHYSYVLPKQARQKVGYYSHVLWSDSFRRNEDWFRDSYQELKRPLFLGERGWPILQWLERYRGPHPEQIELLRAALERGEIDEEQRPQDDIERLLASPWYWLATRLLRVLMPPYWALQKRLRRPKRPVEGS